jgi:hypothetical protein
VAGPATTPLVSSTPSHDFGNISAARVATIAPQDCPCSSVRRGLATWSTKMRRTRSVSSAAVVTAKPPWRNTEPAQAWPSLTVMAQRLMSSSARVALGGPSVGPPWACTTSTPLHCAGITIR